MRFKRVRSVVTICALLVTAAFGQAQPVAIEQAVLAADWSAIATLMTNDSERAKDPSSRIVLAHAYLAGNNNNAAMALLLSAREDQDLRAWRGWTENLLKKAPGNPVAMYLAADALARLGDFDNARVLLNRAIETKRPFPMAYSARGVVNVVLGRWDDAEVDFELATRHEPRFSDAHANKGVLGVLRSSSISTGGGALEAFQRAIALDADFALAINGRGCLRFGSGEFEKAAEDFQLASALSPLLAVADLNLGYSSAYSLQLSAMANAMDQAGPGTTLQRVSDGLAVKLKEGSESWVRQLTPVGEVEEFRSIMSALPWILQDKQQVDRLIARFGEPKFNDMVAARRADLASQQLLLYREVLTDHSKITSYNWGILVLRGAEAMAGIAANAVGLARSGANISGRGAAGWDSFSSDALRRVAKSSISAAMPPDNASARALLTAVPYPSPTVAALPLQLGVGAARNFASAGAAGLEYGRSMTEAGQEIATIKAAENAAQLRAIDSYRQSTTAVGQQSLRTSNVSANSLTGLLTQGSRFDKPPYSSAGTRSNTNILPPALNHASTRELTNQRFQSKGPGGVSTEELARAFVDKGNWPVLTTFGLQYPPQEKK